MSLSENYFSKNNIQDIVEKYCVKNPREDIHSRFEDLLTTKESFISRKNFFGHITASAIVLNPTLSKILLVHHKIIGKWLQPGGHVDNTDTSFSQTAMRELAEETGFNNIVLLSLDNTNSDIPLDIDIHSIPKNQKKQEPEHLHFDFRYVFVLQDSHQGKISEEEIGGIAWKSIREFEQNNPDLPRIAQKVRNLISERRDEIFFNKIIGGINARPTGVNIVMVSHIVPGILPFIQTLQQFVETLHIIPKPNSISPKVLSRIPKKLIHSLSRDQLKNNEILQKIFPNDMKSFVIDVGGYFATKEFFEFNNREKRVIGIIEDTENGFIKYEKLGDMVSLPVISVARSELKQNEDNLVGYSITYYVEMILRKFRRLPRYSTTGIIGYGKLGKGIATYLFNQNIKPFVYDTNPIRVVEAYKDGCIPIEKEDLLSSSSLVLCATGSQSLTQNDFLMLRPGCYVASVTSSDDEFDLSGIADKFEIMSENKFVKKFSNSNTHWYLIKDGNAVNFIDPDGDSLGDFIRLVQGEIIIGLKFLIEKGLAPGLQEVSQDEKKSIARVFLQYYASME